MAFLCALSVSVATTSHTWEADGCHTFPKINVRYPVLFILLKS